MTRRPPAPTIAALVATVLMAGGCTSAGSSAAPSTSVPTVGPAATAPSTVVTARPTVMPVMVDVNDLLILRMATVSASAASTVIDPGSRRILFDLADGVVSQDWRTLVSVVPDGDTTRVQVTTPEGGELPVWIRIAGAWRLPTIGLAKRAAGLSVDGRTVVLEEAPAAGAATAASRSRFAVVATSGATAPRILTLAGGFSFDAVSPDGRWLYVIEHQAGGDPADYQVRQVDVATGALSPGVIVDKRNLDEQMTGYAVTQQTGRGGWVYTLYRGADGAFIHALDTSSGTAFCIDLPGTDRADEAATVDWGLALDPAGDTLYAANGAIGTISAIDLTDFSVRRTATVAVQPVIRFAKLEQAQPAGGRLAVTADGATLYVVGSTGIAVVRAADLVTVGHLGADRGFRSVAAGSAGAVYAVDDAGHAVVLRAGAAPVVVADGTYTSIEAIVLLH